MDTIEKDKLEMLNEFYKVIKNNPSDKSKWGYDAQSFSIWYKSCNEATKFKAKQIYGTNPINDILEYADQKNFIDFENDYKKITDYDKPDKSWKLSAWGCANCYDNSSDKIKNKIIEKYGKDFVDKVLNYREEMHKKNQELFNSKLAKDVPYDIIPIMPLLDDGGGILFYSKEKNKLYVFDFIPSKISSDLATKENIYIEDNSLRWKEELNLFSYEYAYITATYDAKSDSLSLYSDKTIKTDCYFGGIPVDYKITKEKENSKIDGIRYKLKDFNEKYFIDNDNQFIETKNYIKNHFHIDLN